MAEVLAWKFLWRARCDMGMKGLEIRFETDAQNRILNAHATQKDEDGLSRHPPRPPRSAARVKDTDAAEGQKEQRHPHFAQSLAQPILGVCFYIAEKTERQMKLFLRKPSQTGKMRVETKQRRLESRRKFEADKKPFRRGIETGDQDGSQESGVRVRAGAWSREVRRGDFVFASIAD